MRNKRNVVIALLLTTNVATLWLLRPAKEAYAIAPLGDVMKLTGIIDLERRLVEDGRILVGDAVVLRQRAVALRTELDQTYQRLQVTDTDLGKLSKDLDELKQYRDIVKRLTGR